MGIGNQEYIVIIVAFLAMIAIVGVFFCLGAWYGVIDERGRWHQLLLKDVKKDQSLRWTKTIIITYPSERKDVAPKINVVAGSTKSAGTGNAIKE